MTADAWAARLAGGERIAEQIAIVVAHADDETLFAGTLLGRADDALLIHVTDSAPHDMTDARRLGFATRADYAAARAGELAGVAMVATHAYEGGHPDHDAVACAVRLAIDRLDPAPALVEFPSYHLRGDARIWAEFWPDTAHPERVRDLTAADTARIDAALAAHASQAGVFEDWRPRVERWRAAPRHDFTAPPPPDACLYDRFGWTITSDRWRRAVIEAVGHSAGSGTSAPSGG